MAAETGTGMATSGVPLAAALGAALGDALGNDSVTGVDTGAGVATAAGLAAGTGLPEASGVAAWAKNRLNSNIWDECSCVDVDFGRS